VPLVEILEGRPRYTRPISYDGDDYLDRIEYARRAAYARDFLIGATPLAPRGIPAQLQKDLELVQIRGLDCIEPGTTDMWVRSATGVARSVNSGLPKAAATAVWSTFENADCAKRLPEADRRWLELFAAIGARDPAHMASRATELLGTARELTPTTRRYLLTAALTGLLATHRYEQATQVWNEHSPSAGVDINIRLLYAYLAVMKKLAPQQR